MSAGSRGGWRLGAGVLLGLILSGVFLWRLREGRSAAPSLWPDCQDPVGVAWSPAGERLGCRSAWPALVDPIRQDLGCRGPRPNPPAVGRRLVLKRGSAGSCEGQEQPLPGSALLALGLPLSLNEASASDLEALPALGPGRARAIIADRQQRGPFSSLASLTRVKGIGPSTLAALEGQLVVRPEESP